MTKQKQIRNHPVAVDAYLASLPNHVRFGLEELRYAIAAAAPGAEPGISYGMPCFRMNRRPLV